MAETIHCADCNAPVAVLIGGDPYLPLIVCQPCAAVRESRWGRHRPGGRTVSVDRLFAEPCRPESVVRGRDRDVIPLLLDVHALPEPRILDACHNRGVMWKGLKYDLTTMDIDPQYGTEFVADFRSMPFGDESFEVIAFDPPHLPAASASANSSGIERHQYGLTEHGDWRQGDNVSPGFEPFLREAKRVLVDGGIVIAKIADLVHNHHYQWQHIDFVEAVRAVGMTPCDVIIKCDPAASNLKSSKWENVRHFRRAHCYWIVARKGRCERRLPALRGTDKEERE